MNILVLTTKLITSENSGYTRRLYPFLKELKKNNHKITLITFYENNNELNNLKQSCEYWDKVITVRMSRMCGYLRMLKGIISGLPFKLEFVKTFKMSKTIERELQQNNYDIIYSHFYRMAYYMKKYKKYKCYVDLCDSHYLLYQRQLEQETNLLKQFFIKIEKERILKYEKSCINEFNKISFISETDKNVYTNIEQKHNIAVIPNGVDTEYFYNKNKAFYNSNEIIYLGSMFSVANHDAVMYFLNKIYPLIKQKNPSVVFKIVGANPRQELLEFVKKDSSVIVTGAVDDVREHIENACISVAPVRIAAGVQNKILETLSMGIPTVTTPEGIEGIENKDNTIIVADSDESFASKVLEILGNKEFRERYSQNGRDFCVKNYSWKVATKKMENFMEE